MKKFFGRILYKLIGSHLPQAHFIIRPIGIISKKFRGICEKLILDHCGKNVNIYPHAKFSSSVSLGDNSDIGLNAKIFGKTIIGNDVIMGPDVVVYTRNHSSASVDTPIKYQGVTNECPVFIGDGTWICTRVILLPGVHIGKNCIVGAGAVVTKSFPDNCVIAGNPAKIVKNREER